jgi:pyruvate formate lyase activating enzyme
MAMKEALFWTKSGDSAVRCSLCPHNCIIKEGARGICGVRENRGGTLFSLVWGKSIAASIDPIEKKPLFHVLPGSKAYSIATVGCNLKCSFCQNSDISQYPAETGKITGREMLPETIVNEVAGNHCECISYTYTEPTVFMEYVLDISRLAKEKGILNTIVTNGYTSAEVIKSEFPGLIDAANIDLKAFTDRFYRRLCKARLAPVLAAIKKYHEAGVWIEITTLLIPGENDSAEEVQDIARFIKSVSADIPWHISRYYPRYRYDKAPSTPLSSLEKARETGLAEGLNYVYTGNVPGTASENTYCPSCGNIVLRRMGFSVLENRLKGNACSNCGNFIAGRFKK